MSTQLIPQTTYSSETITSDPFQMGPTYRQATFAVDASDFTDADHQFMIIRIEHSDDGFQTFERNTTGSQYDIPPNGHMEVGSSALHLGLDENDQTIELPVPDTCQLRVVVNVGGTITFAISELEDAMVEEV